VAQGKRFSPEFRQEAVRLYRVSGRPFRDVAGELAVAPSCCDAGYVRPRSMTASGSCGRAGGGASVT
jgi:hypothetical protein